MKSEKAEEDEVITEFLNGSVLQNKKFSLGFILT